MIANGQVVTVKTSQKFLIDYDQPSMDLIRQTYAKDATPAEFQLLLYMSRTYGLDILTKKIWCVKYGKSAAQIFAGRDGFLEIAHSHSSKAFDGMNTTIEEVQKPFTVKCFKWEGYGENSKKVFFDKTFDTQYKARTEVWRKDMTRPFIVEVWEEEYSTGMDNWEKKRRTMISKVSESQCLRKGFSISGLYAPEEIEKDDPDIQTAVVVEDPKGTGATETATKEAAKEDASESDAQEEVKRLKFLRGELNQALLECKDEKAYKIVNGRFTRSHGDKIWSQYTCHDKTETFYTLSMEHGKRFKPDPAAEWRKKLDACREVTEFRKLEQEFINNPAINNADNEALIDQKGEILGLPEYTKAKQEGAE